MASVISTKPRRSRKPGVFVLLFGVVLIIVGLLLVAIRSGSALYDALGGDVHTTPYEQTLRLDAETYLVYELVGVQEGGLDSTVTTRTARLSPGDVSVTDTEGGTVPVRNPSTTQRITRNSSVYEGVAIFDVPKAGDYIVSVSGSPGVEFYVGPSLGTVLKRAVPGIVLGFLGFVAVFTGLLMVILASRRPKSAAVTVPPATFPPAGWYDDPHNPGYQRWWDGNRWAP